MVAGVKGVEPLIPNLKDTEYSLHNGKSYSELPPNIKNLVSHRWDAFHKLKNLF
jgi:hypothetical protein